MPLEEEAHAFASAELDVQDGNVRLVRIRQTGGRIDVVSGPHAGQLPGCLYGDGESLGEDGMAVHDDHAGGFGGGLCHDGPRLSGTDAPKDSRALRVLPL